MSQPGRDPEDTRADGVWVRTPGTSLLHTAVPPRRRCSRSPRYFGVREAWGHEGTSETTKHPQPEALRGEAHAGAGYQCPRLLTPAHGFTATLRNFFIFLSQVISPKRVYRWQMSTWEDVEHHQATKRQPCIAIGVARIKTSTTTTCWRGCGETASLLVGTYEGVGTLETAWQFI